MPLTGKVLDSPAATAPYRAAWDELAVQVGRPYCAPGWCLAWWGRMAGPRSVLRVVAVLDDGELVGIAPLCAQPPGAAGLGRYQLLAADVSARAEPLARPGRRAEVAEVLAETLCRMRPRLATLSLQAAPLDSTWPALLADGWPGRHAPWVHRSRLVRAPALDLPEEGFEAWIRSKSRNFRQQMRRARRALEAQGATFHVLTDERALVAELPAFARLHRARWRDRGGSQAMRPGAEAALATAATELSALDRMRLVTVRMRGETISSQLFVTAGGLASYWLGGFDERWSAQHPSMVALVEGVADAIERGDRHLDLGPGPQTYKYRLADGEDLLETVTLVPVSTRYPLTRLAFGPQQAKAAAAEHLPPGPQARLRSVLGTSGMAEETGPAGNARLAAAPPAYIGAEVASVPALVTDAHLRSVVAGIRGLGRAGCSVTALAPAPSAPGLWSRFTTSRHVAPDVSVDPAGLAGVVGAVARSHERVAVYPGQEATIDALLSASLPSGAMLPYPSREPLRLLRDKRALAAVASDAGLAAPRTLVEGTAEELARGSIRTPCVLKPAGSGGALLTARPVASAEELAGLLAALPREEPLLVQEQVRGPLEAIALVVGIEGEVLARFQQSAIRLWPPEAGISSAAVSVEPDEALVARAAAALAGVGYAGMAQLQFVDGGSGPALIDVNPRFYGSMPLALACGVNLPATWHALVCGEPRAASPEYRVGVSFRWLAGDLLAVRHGEPRRLLDRPPAPRAGAVWAPDDPVPSVLAGAETVAGPLAQRLAAMRFKG
ncbi:MAG TPA: GNAT family N-acetyltransferase [Thermoleophilaceae bacterium]|nr:GNAT family N-acetyltransferase [Thermoleophilaceae bacterium]